jgi:hypothetical protein
MPWVSDAERGTKLSGSHDGQVEQPNPEPVNRTAAPVTMMNTRDTNVTKVMTR